MAMIPENPVVGGVALRRAAIMSPNFVHNSAGWAINQDGTAEFNSITIRNGQVIGGNTFTYNVAFTQLLSSNTQSATTDPVLGISCPQGFATYNSHGKVINLLSTANNAFFQYLDAGAAQGQLILSVASAAGTDPVDGSAYQAGLFGIDTVGSTTEVVGASIQLGEIAFTRNAFIGLQIANTNALQPFMFVDGPEQTTASHILMQLLGASPDGTTKLAQLAVAPVAGTGGYVTVTNALFELNGGTGQTVAELIAHAAATLALAARVTADTNDRFTVSAAGVVSWGTGAAGTDTSVQRSAAGVLQVLSTLVTTVAGVAEIWHTLGTLAGYTVTVGLFRLDVLGNLELDIVVVAGGANAVSTTFSVTLPAAYRPVNQKEIPAATSTNIAAGVTQPRVVIATTGAVTVQLAANSTSTLYMSGMVPLN